MDRNQWRGFGAAAFGAGFIATWYCGERSAAAHRRSGLKPWR